MTWNLKTNRLVAKNWDGVFLQAHTGSLCSVLGRNPVLGRQDKLLLGTAWPVTQCWVCPEQGEAAFHLPGVWVTPQRDSRTPLKAAKS